ncbi:MAG: isochorismate synthase [Acidimicrobiia bacterium]|nr:isochorismate synthase [Acidimicrobiia bacterium]MDH5237842.1 isochorismate synthase [Acidimicrobiia bacterium]
MTAVGERLAYVANEHPADVDPLAVYAHSRAEHRAYFGRDDVAMAAIGAAAVIELDHTPDVWDELAAARAVLAERVEFDLVSPLLFGGVSFGTDMADRGPAWQRFRGARFVLPELMVVRAGAHVHSLSLGAGVTLDPARIEDDEPGGTAPSFAEDERYVELVQRALAAIADGRFQKVVPARSCPVEGWDANRHIGPTLERLRASYPRCMTFAVTAGRETFFAASPERLVSLRYDELRTLALAGSAPRGGDETTDRALAADLLASAKNRSEHAFVVDDVRTKLEDLGYEPQIPGAPEVAKLANIQHLRTPVRAPAGAESEIFRIAGALHPTPAVCGTPTDPAAAWLSANEGFDRGWYAAPVGWVDLAGKGELRVGLRSALADGSGAHLFAGAGVVADSDPVAELDETTVKLKALGRRLYP